MSNAICILKKDLFPNGINPELKDVFVTEHNLLLDCNHTLEDRGTCETDESLLQIIPYITLFDKKTKEVFIYTRGKASGEQRLAGKCSIGLGGHMETEDKSMSLIEIIVAETVRELIEEVNLDVDDAFIKSIREKLLSGNFGIMHNTRTDVDRVHVAVAMFVGVDKEAIMAKTHEADVITRGQWMSISDMLRATEAGTFEIEHWTRMVLDSAVYAWA